MGTTTTGAHGLPVAHVEPDRPSADPMAAVAARVHLTTVRQRLEQAMLAAISASDSHGLGNLLDARDAVLEAHGHVKLIAAHLDRAFVAIERESGAAWQRAVEDVA